MAFNINEFKSAVNRFGGPAHTGLFQVQFVNVPVVFGSNARPRDLTFFCKAVNMPGMQMVTADYNAVAQRPKTFVKGMASSQTQAQFILDSNHEILSFLHGWSQKVVNYSTSGGMNSEVEGKLPYEIGYKDEYACRMVIRYYSTYQSKQNAFERLLKPQYYEVILDNAFPVAVGDIDLAWENRDQYATVGVAFAYDEIAYSGERSGNPTARLGRGNGLLSLIEGVGNLSQTIGNAFGSRPTSVTDAINKLNRVNSAAKSIRGLLG